MKSIIPFAAPAGRVLLAAMFIMAGLSKITGYEGTQGYMEAFGIPGALLPLVILLEVGAGAAILLGFQTRVAAFMLTGFTFIAAVVFHSNLADQMQMLLFTKNIAIAGALLFLVAEGAGHYSLDNRSKSAV